MVGRHQMCVGAQEHGWEVAQVVGGRSDGDAREERRRECVPRVVETNRRQLRLIAHSTPNPTEALASYWPAVIMKHEAVETSPALLNWQRDLIEGDVSKRDGPEAPCGLRWCKRDLTPLPGVAS
jgi:hypothetical protein